MDVNLERVPLGLPFEKIKMPRPSIPVDWFWDVSGHYEEEGKWFVEGYCTTYDIDLASDQVTPEAANEAVKQLIGRTLLHNHNPDEEIGTVVAARVDEIGIWVKCLVSKTVPKIWTKITEGVLNKFSIRLLEKNADPITVKGRRINRIKSMIITEISLTSLPCNLSANAAQAYVGKSLQEVEEMGNMAEGFKVLAGAIQDLVSDYNSGKLKSVTEVEGDEEKVKAQMCVFPDGKMAKPDTEGKCPEGATLKEVKKSEIPEELKADEKPPEGIKPDGEGDDTDGDDKTKQEKPEYGYGKSCPFNKTDECPVKGQEGEEVKKVAKGCKYAQVYTCPYLAEKETPKSDDAPADATKTDDPPVTDVKPDGEDTKQEKNQMCIHPDGRKVPPTDGKCPEGFKIEEYPAPETKSDEETGKKLATFEGRIKGIEDSIGEMKSSLSNFFTRFGEEIPAKMADAIKPIEEQNVEMQKKISDVEKSVGERIKTLEETSAASLQPDDDRQASGNKDSFWQGSMPF